MSNLKDSIAVFNILIGAGRKFEGVADIVGLIPLKVCVGAGNDEVLFYFTNAAYARLYHEQDCCESVYIESVVGDVGDLVDQPLLLAEESSNEEDEETGCDGRTWTFYKFATIKGYVDIRFLGESNGFYSERVDFAFMDPDGEFNLSGNV